jgi:hypothetical protein
MVQTVAEKQFPTSHRYGWFWRTAAILGNLMRGSLFPPGGSLPCPGSARSLN